MKRLLVIGCGDIARHALPLWLPHYRVAALLRSQDAQIASAGVQTFVGDLDRPESLVQLAGCADIVAHLAPPAGVGTGDQRTRNLIAALEAGAMLPRRFVYVSTSGVYGDCAGERVDESRRINPQTERARRRADAEIALSRWGEARGVEVLVLRVPGIYSAARLPLERLRKGTPALREQDDVHTGHIHAEDLAAIVTAALDRGASGPYNACDDSEIRMGDWFDLVADRAGLPRPPRVSRAEAKQLVPPDLLSFMSESRRLVNRRIKESLGVRLRYPTVHDGVPSLRFEPRGALAT